MGSHEVARHSDLRALRLCWIERRVAREADDSVGTVPVTHPLVQSASTISRRLLLAASASLPACSRCATKREPIAVRCRVAHLELAIGHLACQQRKCVEHARSRPCARLDEEPSLRLRARRALRRRYRTEVFGCVGEVCLCADEQERHVLALGMAPHLGG